MRVRVRTNRRNKDRDYIISWCNDAFGRKPKRWQVTSNYTADMKNDFDVLFSNPQHVIQYLATHGGEITEYTEDDSQTLHKFFGEAA